MDVNTRTRVHICTESIIRVTHRPSTAIPTPPSLVVTAQWKQVPVVRTDTAATVTLRTARVTVVAQKGDGAVTVYDDSGRRVLAETVTHLTPTRAQDGTAGYTVEQSWEIGAHEVCEHQGCAACYANGTGEGDWFEGGEFSPTHAHKRISNIIVCAVLNVQPFLGSWASFLLSITSWAQIACLSGYS